VRDPPHILTAGPRMENLTRLPGARLFSPELTWTMLQKTVIWKTYGIGASGATIPTTFRIGERQGNVEERRFKMNQVRVDEIEAELAFAKKAAKCFAENESVTTYTESDIVPGCFFAIRWGLDRDCVVVFKVAEDCIPTNYSNLVKDHKPIHGAFQNQDFSDTVVNRKYLKTIDQWRLQMD
jgi:hypothetical protein